MNSSRMSANAGANESLNGPALRLQAVIPLTSVDHGHTSVRSPTNNLNASHPLGNDGTPTNSLSQRSKRDSPAGTPSHRTRSNNASAFFSPPATGELVESGISPTTRRVAGGAAGGAKAIPAAPSAAPAASVHTGANQNNNHNHNNAAQVRNGSPKENIGAASAPDLSPQKKGRRASRQGNANWFESEKAGRPADTELNQNVVTVNDGIADQELARREQAERAQRQQEQLAQHISDPPTGFQATLPRLNELDVTNSWDRLLRMMRNEYDMTCLTSCLARELDEDVAWNPEMLLVQLTSDMMDAAELQQENETYVPVDASDIGQMTGGEVVRKRGEKAPAGTTAPPEKAAAPAAAAGAAASPKNGARRADGTLVGGGGGGAAPAPGAAAAGAGGGGAPASKLTASIVEPDGSMHRSPAKRKSSAASKASAGGAASANSPKREGKPLSTKKSGARSFLKK